MRPYQNEVSNGIKLLDSILPDWRGHIDLSTLDLGNPQCCILGQLDGYNTMVNRLFPEFLGKERRSAIEAHGFELPVEKHLGNNCRNVFQILTDEWKQQLNS